MSVLFAEVATSSEALRADPEDLRQVVGEALTRVINEVEGLGGTVTSVSGGGLQALFGAPEAHEDDPERALRAAFRALSAQAPSVDERPSVLRIGVETGAAVVGQIGAGARFEYGAVGAVVGTAAALQSVAKPGSALVGPVTRAAVEGLFEWGATEVVTQLAGAKPFVGSYLEQPKARAPSRQMRLGGRGPLVGRQAELSVLDAALRDAEGGMGSVYEAENLSIARRVAIKVLHPTCANEPESLARFYRLASNNQHAHNLPGHRGGYPLEDQLQSRPEHGT